VRDDGALGRADGLATQAEHATGLMTAAFDSVIETEAQPQLGSLASGQTPQQVP
jgi:hypothetical protein